MSTTLSEAATKLLTLIQDKHEGMHFVSAMGGDDKPFVQVMLPVSELNKIAEGMAVLASLVVLNPSHVAQNTDRRHG